MTHPHNPYHSSTLGFTLIELIITIAIAAIAMGIGIPSFSKMISNSRLSTSTNDLVTAFHIAKSEAIKRGQPITIKKSGTNWEDGWTVFTDLNGNTTLDAGDDMLLRQYDSLASNLTLRASSGSFIYQASGLSNAGNFKLCDNSDGNNTPEAHTAKVTIINTVGRVIRGADANGNHIPEIAGNDITSCLQ